MTLTKTTSVICPNCQKSSEIIIWQTVNVQLNPELREKVLDRSLFTWTCPSCKSENCMAYPILYHDQSNQIMVWLLPNYDQDILKRELVKMNRGMELLPGSYRLRVVPSLNRLVEKILIFERKLDDRVIELVKFHTWINSLKDKGISQENIFFEWINMQAEPKEISFVLVDQESKNQHVIITGDVLKDTAKFLFGSVKVAEKIPLTFRVVDHTYIELVKNGEG